ncbi:hypothetical protein C1E23_02615 [Pseudoalteromonas phenolica]|uniref:Capsule assembly Wzi family protein n=1 Tax=Pseudoalteromonas phenolica TaxID=161398 RepID=A0A4Q7IQF1_9GAMM|nr:capsule assembly Wzi family protein [Pseudoalteromonas phenolica]RZQ54544.1 hypothetical protein C1E23_02615 [Pseudoalteromonas phenolica]
MKLNILAIAIGLSSFSALSSPWIDAEQTQLKHSIDLLVSHKLIKRPVNQYPLLWRGLVQDMAAIDYDAIPESAQFALAHVKHALNTAKQKQRSGIKAFYNQEPELGKGFGERQGAKSGVKTFGQITSKNVSSKVQVNYTDDALDKKYINHYGSHVAVLLDNWSASLEQLNYWWGPGNEQALLLSNHAAPMKAVRLSRANTDYQGPSFLSFIGPWQITAIAAKQKPNLTSKKKGDFWGIRLSSMPLAGLEVAFSSTASDFIFHSDEQQPELHTKQRLTSLDAKYSSAIQSVPFAVYAELAGENDKGLLTDNTNYTLGVESYMSDAQCRAKGFIEISDTLVDCQAEQASFQCNFTTPETGGDYKNRNQWLGAAMGPQAKSITLGVDYYRLAGFGGYAKLKQIDFDALELDRTLLEVGYQQGFFKGLGKLGVSIWQDKQPKESETHIAVSASWEIQF